MNTTMTTIIKNPHRSNGTWMNKDTEKKMKIVPKFCGKPTTKSLYKKCGVYTVGTRSRLQKAKCQTEDTMMLATAQIGGACATKTATTSRFGGLKTKGDMEAYVITG